MVAPYSARARERPTVSTPLRWEELETDDPRSLVFELGAVLARVEAHGDLLAATPRPGGSEQPRSGSAGPPFKV
jgi:DNA primase